MFRRDALHDLQLSSQSEVLQLHLLMHLSSSRPAEIKISLVGHLPSWLGKPPLHSSWKAAASTCFAVSLRSFRSSVQPQHLPGALPFAAAGQLAQLVPPADRIPLLTPAVVLCDGSNQILRVSYIRGRKWDSCSVGHPTPKVRHPSVSISPEHPFQAHAIFTCISACLSLALPFFCNLPERQRGSPHHAQLDSSGARLWCKPVP